MTGNFEGLNNTETTTQAVDYRPSVPFLPGVICKGVLSATTCDITLTIPSSSLKSSTELTTAHIQTTAELRSNVIEQQLAIVQIKTSNTQTVQTLQKLIASNNPTNPEAVLEGLVNLMRYANHASQTDPNSLYRVTSGSQLFDYLEVLRRELARTNQNINPQTLACMVWATTILTGCYQFNPTTFSTIFATTLPLQKTIDDSYSIALLKQYGPGINWHQEYQLPRYVLLGPLAEGLLLDQTRNSPFKQPEIHPSLIPAFAEWCDTRNPLHLRILGRLLPQSEGESEESIDIALSNLCDRKERNKESLSLEATTKCIFQGLIEGGLSDLSLKSLYNRCIFIAKLSKGIPDQINEYVTLDQKPSILDAFTFMPHELVRAGILNCRTAMIEQCLRRWNDIDSASQDLITLEMAKHPVELFQEINWSMITLPPPIQNVLYQEEIFKSIWQKESATVIQYMEVFPNLPEHSLKHFIEANLLDVVLRNRSSFVWTNNSKQRVLNALIEANDMNNIIQNMDFFPDTLFKRCCRNNPRLISFKKDSRLPLPEIYELYDKTFQSKGAAAAKAVLIKAQEIVEKIVSPGQIPENLQGHEIYPAIFCHAYGMDTAYQKLAMVPDRTEDLELFEVPEIERLDLLAGKRMVLRNRVHADISLVNRLQRYINEPKRILDTSVDIEKDLRKSFAEIIDEHFSDMSGKSLEEAMLGALLTLEQNPSNKHCRRLSVLFHAIKIEQFRQYARASQDRIDQAPNRDYAYLLELREFLETVVPDTIRESIRRVNNDLEDSYMAALADLFAEDLKLIDLEIRKYTPEGSSKSSIPRISAFFAKNSQSAGMLYSAGVCVAGDVPRRGLKHPNDTMWSLENYFNLVFRDDETKRCVGGVLLHYYEERDKQILSASINPSASLLYKTDERRFFQETMRILVSFAESNDIDMIVTSTDSAIRTNRTGGLFEQALDAQIRKYNQKFALPHEEIFSFNPLYYQKTFDVIWLAESST